MAKRQTKKLDRVTKFGEVFTPDWAVERMLDMLSPDCWTNPNIRFVEPAVGNGQFIKGLVNRLMVGLEAFEPDPVTRYFHIIEKCIYAVDIQADNIDACIERFCLSGMRHNFVVGNSLKMDIRAWIEGNDLHG